MLGGLYLGLLEGNVSYLRTIPGDVVVSEEGAPLVTTLLQSSRIARADMRAVRALPGVEDVAPLHGRLVSLSRGPAFTLVYLVGRRWSDPFAGPVRVRAGRGRPHMGEIVVDRVLARDLGQGLGGEVVVGDAHLRIVGIVDGGNAVLGTYAFVHRGALVLAGFADPAYLFVRAAPGADPEDVARRIDALPRVRAVTRERFLWEKQAPFRQMLLPVIGLVVGLAAAAGGAVVGVVLVAAALERRRDHGVLRAVGLTRRGLLATALVESGIASTFGVAAGLAAGRAVAAGLGLLEPRFLTVTPPWLALAIALGAAALTLAATVLPLRSLARLELARVLRA